MFDYYVAFVFDYFTISTSVYAVDDNEAERTAIDRLKEVAGVFIDDMGRYSLTLERRD